MCTLQSLHCSQAHVHVPWYGFPWAPPWLARRPAPQSHHPPRPAAAAAASTAAEGLPLLTQPRNGAPNRPRILNQASLLQLQRPKPPLQALPPLQQRSAQNLLSQLLFSSSVCPFHIVLCCDCCIHLCPILLSVCPSSLCSAVIAAYISAQFYSVTAGTAFSRIP